MKTKDLIGLQKEYGDLTIGEILSKYNRHFICPKCNGKGTESILVKRGDYGYSDDIYKNVDCDVCDGHGYTQRQFKPKIKTEIIGYE